MMPSHDIRAINSKRSGGNESDGIDPFDCRPTKMTYRYIWRKWLARPLTRGMRKAAFIVTLGALLSLAPASASPQDKGTQSDNTKVNKRDRASGAVTADQQKENTNDRELSANIRKAVMDDKELSTYAHNVKIVAHNGIVTLKGPVRS